MKFTFDERLSDSPFVETIWHSQSEGAGLSFTSVAEAHFGIVITRQKDRTWFTVRGPETSATPAPIPEDADFTGIIFKLGTFMPHLPVTRLVDAPINLPDASSRSFWLNSSAWEFPTYENIDTFVERLVRQGLLVSDPLVADVLKGKPQEWTMRSERRRFVRATGLTYGAVYQIERARQAQAMLERGVSILDTIEHTGYFDQPHLTRSLKRFVGQTPAQILRAIRSR
jgi:hypothetical protein